jgi:hypothetical protein
MTVDGSPDTCRTHAWNRQTWYHLLKVILLINGRALNIRVKLCDRTLAAVLKDAKLLPCFVVSWFEDIFCLR